jgi:predicted porin
MRTWPAPRTTAWSSNIKSNNLWTVGLTAPIGRGTLGIGYGRLSLNNRNMQDGDSWGAGTMYTYPLSKRTAIYAAYSYFSNDKYSIPGQSIAIAVPGNGVGALGESNYALGAGLRHSF